ncbi:unnamed protein product [Musa acuminata var. zebrina]
METAPCFHVLSLACKASRYRQRRTSDRQQRRESSPRAARGRCILGSERQSRLVEHPCAALLGPSQPPRHGRQELQHGYHRELYQVRKVMEDGLLLPTPPNFSLLSRGILMSRRWGLATACSPLFAGASLPRGAMIC